MRRMTDVYYASINNKASDFYVAQAKYGYGGLNNICTSWPAGASTVTYSCLPTATIGLRFKY